jgi:hypothetical protein
MGLDSREHLGMRLDGRSVRYLTYPYNTNCIYKLNPQVNLMNISLHGIHKFEFAKRWLLRVSIMETVAWFPLA